MKLYQIEELNEDHGEVILMNISNTEEAPYCRNGHCCDSDFDEGDWTHFVELDFNSLLRQVKESVDECEGAVKDFKREIELNTLVDKWHEDKETKLSLHEYLDMSWEEFSKWV